MWIALGLLATIVIVILLREPFREMRRRRAEEARERKRQWRRDRDAERARRREERAMNPARAAARAGMPTWQSVAKASGSKCTLCGTRTFPDDRQRGAYGTERLGKTYPTVILLTPLDDGGTFELDNARIAHRHCAAVREQHPGRGKYGTPPRTFGG